ncbi:MAG: fluoride efflux transporter CrcB [Methylohalobius sp.]
MTVEIATIALGGAAGALLRFAVSSAVYRLLGRGFPYGTLAVNLIGSFLFGLWVEALPLERLLGLPWRPLLLTGVLGAFTTFSTFALETVFLLEQGRIWRALANIAFSLALGLVSVWIGLLLGRALFIEHPVAVPGGGWLLPWLLGLFGSGVGAFILGLGLELVFERLRLPAEHRILWTLLLTGGWAGLASLYLVLELIPGYAFKPTIDLLVGMFAANLLACALGMWAGFNTAGRV